MAEIADSGSKGGKHGGKVRGKKHSTKIDMTPMVDLAFLLLTFFIMTTTFAKPKIMEIAMPKKPKPDDPIPPKVRASETLTLMMDTNNILYWYMGTPDTANAYKTTYAATGLRKLINSKQAVVGEKLVVLIKATERAKYKNFVDVLDEMNINNVKKYAVSEMDDLDKKKIPDL